MGACVDSRSERAGGTKSKHSSRGSEGLRRYRNRHDQTQQLLPHWKRKPGAQSHSFFSLGSLAPSSCAARRDVAHHIRFRRSKIAKPAIQLPWLPSRGTRRGTFWWRGVAVGLLCFEHPLMPLLAVGAVTQPRAGHTGSSPCDPCKSSAFGEVPFPMPPWRQCQDVASATPKHGLMGEQKLMPPHLASTTRIWLGTSKRR
jgi:hypothetical protein